jgi:nucleotide-binding universal stress UspA family protein
MDRILFPTDFSDSSRQALDHALFLAREFGAQLHALHAVILHQSDPADPDHVFESGPELLDHLMKAADSELGKVGRRVGDTVRVKQARRRGFSPGVVILEYAEQEDIDLIVMGTHGRSGPRRFFLGSVTAEVVRNASCPVMTLRVQEGGRPLDAIDTILLPVDFSDETSNALRHAAILAERVDATVVLLHVVDAPVLPAFYGPVQEVGSVDRLLDRAERELEALGRELPAEVKWSATVREGQAWREIVAAAQEGGADLIVVPTHGHGAIERMLLGSTTERVLRAADCPVLTLRPGTSIL